jgi:hypothetical protein
LLCELELYGIEQVTIQDRRMLAGTDFALEDHFANIESVAQEIGEGASGEGYRRRSAARVGPRREVRL